MSVNHHDLFNLFNVNQFWRIHVGGFFFYHINFFMFLSFAITLMTESCHISGIGFKQHCQYLYIYRVFCPVIFSPLYTCKSFAPIWIRPYKIMFKKSYLRHLNMPGLKFAHWQQGPITCIQLYNRYKCSIWCVKSTKTFNTLQKAKCIILALLQKLTLYVHVNHKDTYMCI